MTRIRYYLKELRSANNAIQRSIAGIASKLAGSLRPPSDHFVPENFSTWLAHFPAMRELPPDPTPDSLVDHIRWALEAKRTHSVYLKAMLAADGQPLPPWIHIIFKLGRYAIASMAFLQLASEFPSLFNPMLVEPVTAPQRTQFTIPQDEMPLTSVLRRLASGHEADYTSRLARVWGVKDPETHFRNACTLNLPVHAEMQLLDFYDHNPERRPTFRFFGVSKKSCFLCHRFLMNHRESFGVSSCHQKLYPQWRPPPATNPTIYRRHKVITNMLSKAMEDSAKRDLDSRLGPRRPAPPDSTAGVSLSGLVEPSSARGRIQIDSAITQAIAIPGKPRESGGPRKTSSLQTIGVMDSPRQAIEVTNSPPQTIEITDSTPPDEDLRQAASSVSPTGDSFPTTNMVFHVMRAGDIQRQDIIALADILNTCSGTPSWHRMVEILKDESGVGFKDGEFLMVNDRIRITNERQFLACLRYLRNSMALNFDVYVYD